MSALRFFALISIATLTVTAASQESSPQATGEVTGQSPADQDTAPSGDIPSAIPPLDPASESTDDADYIQRINAEIDRDESTASDSAQDALSDAIPSMTTALLKGIFALSIVLALILVAFYFVRRLGKRVPLLAGANLGAIMGRIHLDRNTSLHFVRTAGRVLVVGVNNNSISRIADFDAADFEESKAPEFPLPDPQRFDPDSFLAQLQASTKSMSQNAQHEKEDVEDDEINALRGDIQRLQRYLREEPPESQD